MEGQGGRWWSIHEINVRCAGNTTARFLTVYADKGPLRIDAAAQNRSMLVNYLVPEPGWVTIEEYSLSGARKGVLVDGFRSAGNHVFTCTIDRFSSKMVILKLSFKGSSQVKKLILVK